MTQPKFFLEVAAERQGVQEIDVSRTRPDKKNAAKEIEAIPSAILTAVLRVRACLQERHNYAFST